MQRHTQISPKRSEPVQKSNRTLDVSIEITITKHFYTFVLRMATSTDSSNNEARVLSFILIYSYVGQFSDINMNRFIHLYITDVGTWTIVTPGHEFS